MSTNVIATDRVKATPQVRRAFGERFWLERVDVIITLGLVALALGLDLYRLGAPSVWYDEAVSLNYARGTLADLPGRLAVINMALYYFILFIWVHALALFGITTNEFLARLPSAIFGALSVGVLYMLGRRFAGRSTGIIGALLYAVSAIQLTAAQTARSYSLELLLILIAWYAWLTLMSSDAGRRWWIVYVASCVLAFTSQVVAIFIVAAQATAFVAFLFGRGPWSLRARRRLLGMCMSLVTIAVLVLPMLYVGMHGPRMTLWLGAPTLTGVEHLLIVYVSNSSRAALFGVVVIAALALIGAVGARIYQARRSFLPVQSRAAFKWDQPALPLEFVVAIACWLIVPLTCSFVTSILTVQHSFSERYLSEVLPAVLLLASLAVQMIGWRTWLPVIGAALVCATLIGTPRYYAQAQVEDMRTPATWLVQHYQPGDGLVCRLGNDNPGCTDDTLTYYVVTLHADQLATSVMPGAPSTATWADVAAYAAQHQRVFFFFDRYSSSGDAAEAKALQSQLDSHYQLIGALSTPTAVVRLYQTRPTSSITSAAATNEELLVRPVCYRPHHSIQPSHNPRSHLGNSEGNTSARIRQTPPLPVTTSQISCLSEGDLEVHVLD